MPPWFDADDAVLWRVIFIIAALRHYFAAAAAATLFFRRHTHATDGFAYR